MKRLFVDGFWRFNRGLFGMPMGWRLWVLLLVVVNAVIPLFFFERLEARLAFFAILVAGMIMGLVTRFTGFSRLLGVGHLVWFPLLAFFWTRLGDVPAEGVVGWWLRAVLLVNAVSLVIDVSDVVRWVRGERQEVVAGL